MWSLSTSVYTSAKCVENVHTLIQFTFTFGLLQKMTCHHWTIYSWQSSNSLGCPLMLKTNYRCVQSLNISVDVAKCVENVHYIHPVTLTFVRYKKRLVLIEQSIHGKGFYLKGCPLTVKNKPQMCWVTQHQCIRCQICGKCSHINSLHSLLDCYKKWLVIIEQSIHGKGSNFIRMSSYAKNKLQMCSVTQQSVQMSPNLWKMFTISLKYTLFLSVLVLIEQSIHGKG